MKRQNIKKRRMQAVHKQANVEKRNYKINFKNTDFKTCQQFTFAEQVLPR